MHLHIFQVLHFAREDYSFHNLRLLYSFLGIDTYVLSLWFNSTGDRTQNVTLGKPVPYSFNPP